MFVDTCKVVIQVVSNCWMFTQQQFCCWCMKPACCWFHSSFAVHHKVNHQVRIDPNLDEVLISYAYRQGRKRDLGARDRDFWLSTRDKTLPKFSETETFDLGLETFRGHDRDVFRDPFVWPLAYIILTAIYTIQIICGSYINDWMSVFLLFFMNHNGAASSCAIILLALYGVAISGFYPHHITGLVRVSPPKIANSGVCFWGTCHARESRRQSGLGFRENRDLFPNRLGGLWERRELLQRGPRRIPGRQRFWCILWFCA
jgi:hypothetical protein